MRLTGLWWWIDRWRSSTAYMELNLEQQGAYRNLLDEAALRGGAIPDNEEILAKACGDPRRWPKVRAAVMARFVLLDDGWHNKTLDEVIRESQRRAEKQRNYRARKGRTSPSDRGNAHGNATGNARVTEPASDGHMGGNNHRPPDPDQNPVALSEGIQREPIARTRAALAHGWSTPLVGTEHRSHAHCGRACVPAFLHRQFVEALGSAVPDPDARVRQFYRDRLAALAPDAVIGVPVKFWEASFAEFVREHFPSAYGVDGRTAARRQGDGRTGAANAHLYDIGIGRDDA